jgi:hypothetical protein
MFPLQEFAAFRLADGSGDAIGSNESLVAEHSTCLFRIFSTSDLSVLPFRAACQQRAGRADHPARAAVSAYDSGKREPGDTMDQRDSS